MQNAEWRGENLERLLSRDDCINGPWHKETALRIRRVLASPSGFHLLREIFCSAQKSVYFVLFFFLAVLRLFA